MSTFDHESILPVSKSIEPNYFVCTLGQAAELNAANPPSFKTINEFLDEQKATIPDEPAVGFPIPSKEGEEWEHEVFLFEELHRGSVMFAELLKGDVLANVEQLSDGSQFTVALLCPSSPLFLFVWLGLMRLGCSVLLIAPQCQPSAISHLCKTCNASALFYDEMYERLANDSMSLASDGFRPTAVLLPFTDSVEQLYDFVKAEHTEDVEVESLRQNSELDVAYLHHTSGTSTGLPKPIAQSHRAAVGVLPSFSDGGQKATFTTTPLYHGGIADCFRAWTSGALIWLFPGKEVPITAQTILQSLNCAERSTTEDSEPPIMYFSSVPYVLQMLSDDPEGIAVLSKMGIVGVGGAALPVPVGDELVKNGVKLISRFGSAECGFLMSSHRDYIHDKEWQYLRSDSGSEALQFESRDDGLFELVVLPSWPHMAKRNCENGSFATADLFAPHETIAKAWKYHSRADSQLTLITGKKFDPAPLEAAIAASPLLKDALIFGNGQQCPGALLFRSSRTTALHDKELVEELWPTVEHLNSESQAHTWLSKSMLVVMSADAPSLGKSSKGTILRNQAEILYREQIEGAYRQSPGMDDLVQGLSSTSLIADDDIPGFILQTVKDVTNSKDTIPKNADLFSYGVDSVACMRIRAVLQHRLLGSGGSGLPLNVVYDCGTIKRLSHYLIGFRKGQPSQMEDELSLMHELVEEYGNFSSYSEELSQRSDDAYTEDPRSEGDVVILTGATGALGAHILDQLRRNPSVSIIYCLVRAVDPKAVYARVSKSLAFRKKAVLDPADAKVVCVPAKLGAPLLSLPGELYYTIGNTATLIIHAAWTVNFSMRLRSFTKDNIAGLQNLLELALSSPGRVPPRFLFCSSTASVLGSAAGSPILEVVSKDPNSASPLGYSRSKWVAEAICEQVYRTTKLKGRLGILRIGQLCGDKENGVWNVSEAWPLLLSTLNLTRSLPALQHETLDWLPVDVAAQAVLQIAFNSDPTDEHDVPVYHLINDQKSPSWMEMIDWMKVLSQSPFDLVSPGEWVARLEGMKADHPAKKLLGLWKEAYCQDKGSQSGGKKADIQFVKDMTVKAAPIIGSLTTISEAHFAKMWRWVEREMMHGNVARAVDNQSPLAK